jgi:hypothetical protein
VGSQQSRARAWWSSWLFDAPEVLVLAVGFTVVCAVLGWIMRYDYAYTPGDALARTAKAVFVAVSRDPHVGAIGFYWPPFPMLIQIPFVLVLKPLGLMDFAGPLTSAVCVGLSLIVLGKICRELGVARPLALLICAFFAANPVILVYGLNGMSEASMYLCLLVVMLGWLRWVRQRDMGSLAVVSGAMAVGVMIRLESFPVAVILGFLIGASRDWARWLMRWAATVFPAVFSVAVWMATQWILLGDPLAFLNGGIPRGRSPQATNARNGVGTLTRHAASGWNLPFRQRFGLPLHPGYFGALPWAARATLVLAPGLVVAAAAALPRWREDVYPVLGFVGAALWFPVFQMYQAKNEKGFGDFRYFTEVVPIAAVAVAWAASRLTAVRATAQPGGEAPHQVATSSGWRLPPSPRRFIASRRADGEQDAAATARTGAKSSRHLPTGLRWAATASVVAFLPLAAVASYAYMLTPTHTAIGNEHLVLSVLMGRPEPRGNVMADARAIARVLDPYLARGDRVIMDSGASFSVMLATHHPSRFEIQEDRDFRSILDSPSGHFQFIIATKPAPGVTPGPMTALVSPVRDWADIGEYGAAVIWKYVGPPEPRAATGGRRSG